MKRSFSTIHTDIDQSKETQTKRRGSKIKSRPVNSDSETGSDGLKDFLKDLDMVKDIEDEDLFRLANRGKVRSKTYKPIRRKLDDDEGRDEEELDAETIKALKWRPKEGRPPEYMSATIAAQQKRVNPLIKLLGIKIKIVRSDDELDSSEDDLSKDEESSKSSMTSSLSSKINKEQSIQKPCSSPAKEKVRPNLIRSRSGGSKNEELSNNNFDFELQPLSKTVKKHQDNSSEKSEISTTEPKDNFPLSKKQSNLSVSSADNGFSTTEPEDHPQSNKKRSNHSISSVGSGLSTTESEDYHPSNKSKLNVSKLPTEKKFSTDGPKDRPPSNIKKSNFSILSTENELSTTESEDYPPLNVKQSNILISSVENELSTTESEDYPPTNIKQPNHSITLAENELSTTESEGLASTIEGQANTDIKLSRNSEQSINERVGTSPARLDFAKPTKKCSTKNESKSFDINNLVSSRKDSEDSSVNDCGKEVKTDDQTIIKLSYPRIQAESKPNLEILDESQDLIGPLRLNESIELSSSTNKFLKPYQREGVNFFFKHFKEDRNGALLGDDMGLGKTIQVIAFLLAIMGKTGKPIDKGRRKNIINSNNKNLKSKRPFKPTMYGYTCLIICPNSLIENWARELDTWGYFEYAILSSTRTSSDLIKRFNSGVFDIMICGYDLARGLIDELFDLDFSLIVADEAHKLKNPKSAITCALQKFKTKIRFGLTAFVINPILQSQRSNASVYERNLGKVSF
ncbi:hypothetical protein BY996DRAFT_6429552 [Phakopsora pachyrhizi]|nr:hypothetical protein BY996DRAFT_6429552 [Phakopsora pachyrhizi]